MKKEEYVYQVFENIADGYDAANKRISLGLHMRWKKAAVKRFISAVPQGGQVLDLCCGTGTLALMMSGRDDGNCPLSAPGCARYGAGFLPGDAPNRAPPL